MKIFDLNQTEVYCMMNMDYYKDEKLLLITRAEASDEGDLGWDTVFVNFAVHPELYEWIEDICTKVTSLIDKIEDTDEESKIFDIYKSIDEETMNDYSISCNGSDGYWFSCGLVEFIIHSPHGVVEHPFESWGSSKKDMLDILKGIHAVCEEIHSWK